MSHKDHEKKTPVPTQFDPTDPPKDPPEGPPDE